MPQSLLSRYHRKITQMISSVCVFDIHSLRVLVSLWQYCALVYFWQILAPATIHIHLFQEFHHCQHLASLPNLIYLHSFHCKNLTLLWTGVAFIPAQTVFNIDLMSLSTSLNTSKHTRTSLHDNRRRLSMIPCHRTLCKHVVQWDRTTCKDVANCESMVGGILFTPVRYHCAGFLYVAGPVKVSVLLCVPRMISLCHLFPSQYRDPYVLRRATAHFSPAD